MSARAEAVAEALRLACTARAAAIIEEQATAQDLVFDEDARLLIDLGIAAGITGAVAALRDLGLIRP